MNFDTSVDIRTTLTWEPGERLRIRLSGGSFGASPATLTYTIDERADHLRLTYSGLWKPIELRLRILRPLFAFLGKRNGVAALGRLRDLAEQT